jgi:alpha-mannosidase
MWKTQHRTQNVKTHNRRTQKTKKMSNTILMTGKSFVKALHIWVKNVFINIDRNVTALLNQIKTNLNKC